MAGGHPVVAEGSPAIFVSTGTLRRNLELVHISNLTLEGFEQYDYSHACGQG